MSKSKLLILIALVLAANARAQIPVIDASNLVQNINQYLEEVTSVAHQVEQIDQEYTYLTRFGNPNTYVNLLNLEQFGTSVENLSAGIGEVTQTYREEADGATALGYVANGLYENLNLRRDRYGDPIAYNPENFREFSAIQNMHESYNTQQGQYNASMATLQADLKSEMQLLNSDSTQMGTAKHEAKVNALSAQINALSHQTNLNGQRLAAMQQANLNNQYRVAQADKEQQTQERKKDLKNFVQDFQVLLGGQGGNLGVLP